VATGYSPEEQADALALNERMKALQCGAEQVFRFRRADGEYRHLRVHILPRHGADGALLGIVGSADDISDLLAAEQTLRRDNDELEALIGERTRELQQSCADLQEREQTIRTITDSAQDAVVMVDDLAAWCRTGTRRPSACLAGRKPRPSARALRVPLARTLPCRAPARPTPVFSRASRAGFSAHGRNVALNRERWRNSRRPVFVIDAAEGQAARYWPAARHYRASAGGGCLLREKAWSESIIRLAPSFIIGLGRSGEVVLFNDYAERLTGYTRDEVIGKRWSDVFSTPEGRSEDSATIAHALQTGEAINHQPENAILIRSGSPRLVSWSSQIMLEDGEVKMLLSFGVDVTERRRAEDDLKKNYDELKRLNERLEEAQNQLLQSEKMASIGQLAAGVAHEINNPVGFVSSNLQTLKSYSEQMLELIETYQTAATGISDSALLASPSPGRERRWTSIFCRTTCRH
jgi:PAS domain S-box-containing protein